MEKIPLIYKSWILKERPKLKETLGRNHLELRDLKVPLIEEGGALVKVSFLSDASQQLMAMGGQGPDGGSEYFSADLGSPMPCLCAGKIVAVGNNCRYTVGTRIHFRGSYSEYHYLNANDLQKSFVIEEGIQDDDFLSVGSITTGLTAYVGLWKCCADNLKPGKTIVVSAASGGVGQMVIQLAKLEGMRVVAITGGEEKCKNLIIKYGVNEVVDYKDPKFSEKLKEACPNKVDVYFDNVGGEISDEVYGNLNSFARVAVCGLLTDYTEGKGHTFKNFGNILMSRSRIEGFMVFESVGLMFEASKKINTWLKENKLKFEKSIIEFKDAADGLSTLLSGNKKGKLLCRV